MIGADVQRLLLEADVEELDGRSESALAVHTSACESCRAMSQRILEGQEALSGALAALAGGVAGSADPAAARSEVVAVRRRRRVVWRVTAPLAAAAVGALALFNVMAPQPDTAPYAGAPEWAQPLALGASGTVVTAREGDRVAVLPTQNPNITVVWFIK